MYYTCDEPIKPTVVASSTSLVYRPSPTFLSLAVDGTASDGKLGEGLETVLQATGRWVGSGNEANRAHDGPLWM